MTYIGIDVSKDTFVVAYSPEKTRETRTFKNTTKGIHEFIQTISKDEHHCVMEATGNYSASAFRGRHHHQFGESAQGAELRPCHALRRQDG